MADTLRLFVALKPPPDAAVQLTQLLSRHPQNSSHYRNLTSESLHLTLAFLGDTPAPALPELTAALRTHLNPLHPIRLTLDRWITLPPGPKPNVLALEASTTPPNLLALYRQVQEVVRDLSIRYSLPQFRYSPTRLLPHVTLARRRGQGPLPILGGALDHTLHPPIEIPFLGVAVYQSLLLPEGAKYIVKEFLGWSDSARDG